MTAPSSRLRPGLVVALAIAALMFLGIAGLVATAIFGDGTEPSADGFQRQVDVDAPATVPAAAAVADSAGNADAGADAGADAALEAGAGAGGGGAASADTAAVVGDAPTTTADPAPIATVAGIDDIATPTPDQTLPSPGSAPVEFPVLVTTPPPVPTFTAVPLAELGTDDVPELSGWTVTSRDADHVALQRGDEVIDVVAAEASVAADALDWFYDRVGDDVAEVTGSPVVHTGAPSRRFVSVAGLQFVATEAAQVGTSTVSGSALAGSRANGAAVVVAISRPGSSTSEQFAADGELLQAILAHL